jgi:predicted CoA-binding protein
MIMSEMSCPLPGSGPQDDADAVQKLLKARRIAVVGMSPDTMKAGYYVPAYLREQGREVIPVNPTHDAIDGLKSYATLAEVPGKVDLVLVFRRPEYCAEVARDAAAIGAKGLWLQLGIKSGEARQIASDGGMTYVEDRCIMVEMRRG